MVEPCFYHGSTIWSTMVHHTPKPWFNHGLAFNHDWTMFQPWYFLVGHVARTRLLSPLLASIGNDGMTPCLSTPPVIFTARIKASAVLQSKTRGYAHAKIEYVSVRTFL